MSSVFYSRILFRRPWINESIETWSEVRHSQPEKQTGWRRQDLDRQKNQTFVYHAVTLKFSHPEHPITEKCFFLMYKYSSFITVTSHVFGWIIEKSPKITAYQIGCRSLATTHGDLTYGRWSTKEWPISRVLCHVSTDTNIYLPASSLGTPSKNRVGSPLTFTTAVILNKVLETFLIDFCWYRHSISQVEVTEVQWTHCMIAGNVSHTLLNWYYRG